MECSQLKESGEDWWPFKNVVHNYNKQKIKTVSVSYVLVFDESMRVIVPSSVRHLFYTFFK